MKESLIALLNTLKLVETKGESTLIMCDCMRSLASIINEISEKEHDDEGGHNA